MGKALRVLLVEDSDDDQELVARALRRGGYEPEIERVETAEAMGAALASGRWDVVLSDFSMPHFDAVAALRLLQQTGLDLPFIIVSGSVGEETAVAAMKAGAHDYVMKDNLARLVPAVEREMREAEVRRERRAAEEERDRLLKSEQEARAAAEAASRLKDEFLATVSHELKTPLTAIIGWTHLMRSGRMDGEAVGRALEIVERNARTQAQLVADLLDVSGIVSGKLRLDMRPVALEPVVRAAVEAMRPAADAKGILFREVLDPGVGPVSADPDRLQQIIWNLVSNAIKFTPGGGSVEVRVGRAGADAEIAVSDTGAGIRPEFLPRVFDRFTQADSSTTRAFGGLGLGLSIARHLAELHGGAVTAESRGEGRGATFRVRLPLITTPAGGQSHGDNAAGAGEVVPAEAAALSGLRVLVVDDEPDVCELFTVIIKARGAEVAAFTSASEALEELRRNKTDVLVCDLAMPGMDGLSLIREVRALPAGDGAAVPAAALTAYARAEDRDRALASGFQTHVPKPVDPEELVRVVAELAGRVPPRQK
jgi:signal transduction histidine kinase